MCPCILSCGHTPLQPCPGSFQVPHLSVMPGVPKVSGPAVFQAAVCQSQLTALHRSGSHQLTALPGPCRCPLTPLHGFWSCVYFPLHCAFFVLKFRPHIDFLADWCYGQIQIPLGTSAVSPYHSDIYHPPHLCLLRPLQAVCELLFQSAGQSSCCPLRPLLHCSPQPTACPSGALSTGDPGEAGSCLDGPGSTAPLLPKPRL